jgi:hypothetical protein
VLWSDVGLCFRCAADGSNPSDSFLRLGRKAVACLSTALADGAAVLAITRRHPPNLFPLLQ